MDLTDDEKRDAAMACRSLAHIAEKDAAAAGNPDVRAGHEATASKLTKLAAKFEAARTTGSSGPHSPRTPPSSGPASTRR